MRSVLARLVVVAVVGSAVPAAGEPHVLFLKLAVTNPSDSTRIAQNVAVRLDDLRRRAPALDPATILLTATDAATLDGDAAALEAAELPSQVDDLDGDGRADELAFQLDLGPRQTRIVSIAFGDPATLSRLRASYPRRAFATAGRGTAVWESELNAWRLGPAPGVIAVLGKSRPEPGAIVSGATGRAGAAGGLLAASVPPGVGGVAALRAGRLVEGVAASRTRVIASGPVRSIVEVVRQGWPRREGGVRLTSRITQWSGERGFEHEVALEGRLVAELVTGLPSFAGSRQLPPRVNDGDVDSTLLGLWGDAPDGRSLGLGLIVPSAFAGGMAPAGREVGSLVRVKPARGRASWYVTAAWGGEGNERLTGWGNHRETGDGESRLLPPTALSLEAFAAELADRSARLARPAVVQVLTPAAAAQPAPPDTWRPARSKSYQEALGLVTQDARRTAEQWTPILAASQKTPGRRFDGEGFIEHGDNTTGAWNRRRGYGWTGSFWVGELWRLHQKTGAPEYRRWAEQWNSVLLGEEKWQNHDVGFLNFYSSALAHDLTGEPAWREGALRAAARLEQLYNPLTQLVAAWEERGDDTIIDTMMNLQIWWWASRRTGDAHWRELGLKHALRSIEWFVRPDGSVIQSVHYNPGDGRQLFGPPGDKREVRNAAAPGERVFSHTHQGFAADTSWGRGTAWGLYGLTVAYEETRDPRLLEAAERIAAFTLDRLPEDGVSWYDLHDEGVHRRNRDSSAAALFASALLRLSELAPDHGRGERYRVQGERIVQGLIDRYLTPVAEGDTTPPGVLRHGCRTRPHDGRLTYGDYYLLEALLWLDERGIERPAGLRRAAAAE